MKLSIYLNNYFVKYNKKQTPPTENLSIKILKDLSETDHQFIFRGEPTYRNDLPKILKLFRRKDYILTTDATDVDKILEFDKSIPYLSVKWDGINNDMIRGEKPLSLNMNRLFERVNYQQARIEYTFSPYNKDSWEYDLAQLEYFMKKYKLKQPYFSMYQQGQIYNEENFKWLNITKEFISKLNHKGLLTQKTLDYLNNWTKKQLYTCTSPQNELVIMYDGSVRLCQSHRMNEVIGSLKDNTLDEVIKTSEDIRKQAEGYPLRQQCWLSYHYKDNVAK